MPCLREVTGILLLYLAWFQGSIVAAQSSSPSTADHITGGSSTLNATFARSWSSIANLVTSTPAAMGDGSVPFMADAIDAAVFAPLVSRDGG